MWGPQAAGRRKRKLAQAIDSKLINSSDFPLNGPAASPAGTGWKGIAPCGATPTTAPLLDGRDQGALSFVSIATSNPCLWKEES